MHVLVAIILDLKQEKTSNLIMFHMNSELRRNKPAVFILPTLHPASWQDALHTHTHSDISSSPIYYIMHQIQESFCHRIYVMIIKVYLIAQNEKKKNSCVAFNIVH